MNGQKPVTAEITRLNRLIARGALSRLELYDCENFPDIREVYASLIGQTPDSLNENTVEAIRLMVQEVAMLSDQLEQARKEVRQLKLRVEENGSTNVASHNTFRGALARSIAYSTRYETPNSLLWFDVEGLQAINHHFGTDAGDAVLARVRDQLASHIRASDLVGRIRSDEFAVILAKADQDVATSKGMSLVRQIGRDGLIWENRRIEISVCLGVHELGFGDTPEYAMSKAEESLYRRKRLRLQQNPPSQGTVIPFSTSSEKDSFPA